MDTAIQAITVVGRDPESAAQTLREHGVACIPNFLHAELISPLLAEVKAALEYDNYPYGYGRAARFLLDEIPNEFPITKQVLTSDFVQKVVDEFWQRRFEITNLAVMTHDFKYDPSVIYGKLHFDRRRQLKFILYLMDTTSSSGAFRFLPDSYELGKQLYLRAWREALDINTDNATQIEDAAIHTPDSEPRYRAMKFMVMHDKEYFGMNNLNEKSSVPVEGKAGTLLIFDTSVLHQGGVIEGNEERINLKLHSFPYVEGQSN